jgi:excisionase family DNA binding protein
MDNLLTVKQAAERAKISPALIYDLCSLGVLPHFRIGRPGRRGCIRIDPDELDGFLAACRKGEEPEAAPPPKPKPVNPQPVKFEHLRLPRA